MEISRQRLRSSLIDKSFEKCNYCKGSGLILNSTSISEQIIKVIKEKISNNPNKLVIVKCNSVLAENLLNLKKNEIVQLEKNYESKINFYFDNQYSLHDPLIEVENNDLEIKKENGIKKTKLVTKKEKPIKKTTSVKKKKTTKVIKKTKKDTINTKQNNKEDSDITSKSEISNESSEEKTGWWS